jgi:hypothetical protein
LSHRPPGVLCQSAFFQTETDAWGPYHQNPEKENETFMKACPIPILALPLKAGKFDVMNSASYACIFRRRFSSDEIKQARDIAMK